jgi:hypothetical protein
MDHEIREWEIQQRFNPIESEKVEGNLRMTKTRRIIPPTQFYYSNFHGRRPDYQ